MKEDFKIFKKHNYVSFGPYLGVFELDPLFVKKILKLGRKSKEVHDKAGKFIFSIQKSSFSIQ